MSRIWMTGFEQNSLDIFDAVSGLPTIAATGARTGTYCLSTPGAPTFANCRVGISPLRAEIFVRVYAKTVTNTPAASAWFRLSDSGVVTLLEITEAGQVWLGGIGVTDKGNCGALSTAYQMYEIRLLVDNAAGLLDVRVDGVSKVSDSGIDTRVGAVDDVGHVYFGAIAAAASHDSCRFDDIAINNTLGVVSNSWAGPGAILALDPDADGAVLQYTPSAGVTHYDLVNSANDATYVHDDTPGNIDLWEKPAMASYGNQIVAIAWWLRAQRAAGAAEIIAEYRQLGTNWNLGSNRALTAAWDYYGYFTSENPIFAGILTRGLLDAAEFGVKSIS